MQGALLLAVVVGAAGRIRSTMFVYRMDTHPFLRTLSEHPSATRAALLQRHAASFGGAWPTHFIEPEACENPHLAVTYLRHQLTVGLRELRGSVALSLYLAFLSLVWHVASAGFSASSDLRQLAAGLASTFGLHLGLGVVTAAAALMSGSLLRNVMQEILQGAQRLSELLVDERTVKITSGKLTPKLPNGVVEQSSVAPDVL